MLRKILVLICCFVNSLLSGQHAVVNQPLSSSLSLTDSVKTLNLPSVNNDSLKQAANFTENNKPYHFGHKFEVDLDIINTGTWDTLSNGDRVCRLKIHSKNAYSINLVFNRFHLLPKTILFIYNESKTMILGGFDSFNNRQDMKFSTNLIQGENITIEYFEPKETSGSQLNVSKVIHGFRDMFAYSSSRNIDGSEPCNNDINCSIGDDWCIQRRSVARVLNEGYFCTGSLINNSSDDLTPYFLYANHCRFDSDGEELDLSTAKFLFDFVKVFCNAPVSSSGYEINGATFITGSDVTDYALLELDFAPPSGSGIFYSGWSISSLPSESGAYIHHPQGDVMKISTYNSPLVPTTQFGNEEWRVTLNNGVVESGSSGAPLFNQDRKVIGQHRGRDNNDLLNCDNLSGPAFSGRFDVSWNLGLSEPLDNNNTGTETTEAISPPVYLINKKLTGTHRFAALNNLFIEGNVFVPVSFPPSHPLGSVCPENIAPFTTEPGSNVRFKSTKRVSIKKAHFKAGSKVHISTGQVTCEDNPVSGDRVSFCLANVSNMPQNESHMYASLNPEIYTEYSPTGVKENKQQNKENRKTTYSIHPNPSPGLFNINIQSKEQLQVNIEVYDMAGRQVYSKHNARLQEEVDLSGAKSGIYFIRIQASDEIFTEKLVVQ